MKKILTVILIGFVTLNTNIFGMENEQSSSKQNQQVRLSKIDIAKVGAASLGAVFCAWSALMANSTFSNLYSDYDYEWYHYPSRFAVIPFYHFLFIDGSKSSELTDKIIYGGAEILSGITAGTLGFYVYKKLSTLRTQKLGKSNK